MSGAALLADLVARGVRVLLVEGGKLDVRAPRGVLTPELRSAMLERRAELVSLLAALGPPRRAMACADCGASAAAVYVELEGGWLLCGPCWSR